MQDSVLTLGERIVLAARLATIEHIRREIDELAAAAIDRPVPTAGPSFAAAAAGFQRDSHQQMAEIFQRALGQRRVA